MNLYKFASITLLSGSLTAAPVFESLEYGDSKVEVITKLTENPRVEGEYVISMFGETELNDCFKITQKLGETQFKLNFDFDDEHTLNRIDLRSNKFDSAQFDSELKTTFESALRLITRVYGKPSVENTMPTIDQVKPSGVTASHIWQLPEGSLILGIGEANGSYDTLIRFIQERVGQ